MTYKTHFLVRHCCVETLVQRGELNNVTNPMGDSREDALDRSDLTCINEGSITRTATRPGDTDSVIDLAITTLHIANHCNFNVLGLQGKDPLPCSVVVRRSKMTPTKETNGIYV